MNPYCATRNEMTSLLREGRDLADSLGSSSIARRLDAAAEQLDSNRLRLVVVGEFKRGKSSLINALLDQPELCPTDGEITTTLVTEIRFGPVEFYQVKCGSLGEEVRTISRAEVADYVDEKRNPGNPLHAQGLYIQVPNPRLRDGLIIYDTPGVGGLTAAHREFTFAALAEADAALFVVRADCPISAKELEFAKLVKRHCPAFLTVVTWIDESSAPETYLRESRLKLATALGLPADQLDVVAVSNKLGIEYLESGDANDLADSNFPELHRRLDQLLGRGRGAALLGAALSRLGHALDELRTPLESELAGCSKPRGEQTKQLETQLEQAGQRLNELRQDRASWQQELNVGLADLDRTARSELRDGFCRLQSQLDEDLKDYDKLANPEGICRELEAGISALLAETYRAANRRANGLHSELMTNSGLALPLASVRTVSGECLDIHGIRLSVGRHSVHEKINRVGGAALQQAGSQALVGVMAGAGLGALFVLSGPVGWSTIPLLVVTTVVGAKLGAALGALKGLFQGGQQAWRQMREDELRLTKKSLADFLFPQMEASLHANERLMGETVQGLKEEIRRELKQQIAQEIEACENSLGSLRGAQEFSQEQAKRRSEEVRQKLDCLDELARRAERLAVRDLTPTLADHE